MPKLIERIMNTRQVIMVFLYLMSFCVACRERAPWPPETSGPNLPVRYCDIQRGDNNKAVIGYVFADTAAVNWMIPNLMEGTCVFTPNLSDLRKTERILLKEYPSLLARRWNDADGHLFEEGGLRNYARQYLFLINPEGRKFVYVNFILLRWADLEDKEPLAHDAFDSLPPPLPERQPLSRYFYFVLDGGDGYWHALLDLDEEEVLNVSVNGRA